MANFKLKTYQNGNAIVLKQFENYVHGRNVITWKPCLAFPGQSNKDFQAMVLNGMPMADAQALYEKRNKGKK